jgi:hypothetical protein
MTTSPMSPDLTILVVRSNLQHLWSTTLQTVVFGKVLPSTSATASPLTSRHTTVSLVCHGEKGTWHRTVKTAFTSLYLTWHQLDRNSGSSFMESLCTCSGTEACYPILAQVKGPP